VIDAISFPAAFEGEGFALVVRAAIAPACGPSRT